MSKSIKEDIMSQIKNDKITMRARWVFIAKKLGLQSGMALNMLVLILSINAFFFFIKSNNLLLPLHYGPAMWQKLLHSLPYDLILIIIILSLILNYIIKKFDFFHSRPFVVIYAIFLIFIIFWALVLLFSNFNYALKNHLLKTDSFIPYVSDFYTHRCH